MCNKYNNSEIITDKNNFFYNSRLPFPKDIFKQNIEERYKPKFQKVFSLNKNFNKPTILKKTLESLKKSPKQLKFILSLIALSDQKNKWINAKKIYEKSCASASISRSLLKKKLIIEKEIKLDRVKYDLTGVTPIFC